jgi:ADP-ribose pyrophosphatase
VWEAGVEEQTIEQRRLYDGKVVNLRVDTVQLSNGVTATREVVEHRPAVAMVPVDAEGRLVLVRQWRTPAGGTLLEVPAGTTDGGEDIESAVQRELQEEVGYRAGKLTRLCGFWVAPGYCTEYIHIYLAEDLTESRLPGDEDEQIEVVRLTLDEALRAVSTGAIEDAKSQVGILMYATRVRGA